MRLKSIKLAGFKSFVDPTTVPFPSNLTAIVGPNGCGKSNVIDAVRWVMGESSAKHLRGQNMTDVIFSGSSGRQPVGQASIELIFDNGEGKLTGEYARFSEISVRRKLTREGTSSYYLNGTRCRRKDIADIFLGTGLGPRSYAIIEQGMISRLIEAKPEDLRIYLEEAAGISRYKERRKETESRIRHTRSNLERINDLRDELDRQLKTLKRQSEAAEKYKEYKEEERRLRAEIQVLRWAELEQQRSELAGRLRDGDVERERLLADLSGVDRDLEHGRTGLSDASQSCNALQGQYYEASAEISRREQDIRHQQQQAEQLDADLRRTRTERDEAEAHLRVDRERLQQLGEELRQLEPELEQAREREQGSAERMQQAEQAMQDWQQQWDAFTSRAEKPRREAEVQQTRIQQHEKNIGRTQDRLQAMQQERQGLSLDSLQAELAELEADVERRNQGIAATQDRIHEVVGEIGKRRDAVRALDQELESARQQLSGLRGRWASLDELQQRALGRRSEALMDWLGDRGLAEASRLAERIEAEAGWERALETVLGDYLEAVCVDDLAALGFDTALPEGGLLTAVVVGGAGNSAERPAGASLLDKVRSDVDLAALLGPIRTAHSAAEALALRGELRPGQSVITADGVWVGPNWLRYASGEDEHSGVLARKQQLEALAAEIESLQQRLQDLDQQLESQRGAQHELEVRREAMQTALNQESRQLSDVRSRLGDRRGRLEQLHKRAERLDQELADVDGQLRQEQDALTLSRQAWQQALDRIELDKTEQDRMLGERDGLRQALDESRQRARHDRDHCHQLAIQERTLRSQHESLEQNLGRLGQLQENLAARIEQLQSALGEARSPLPEFQAALQAALARKVELEQSLTAARDRQAEAEAVIRRLENARSEQEGRVGQVDQAIAELRIELRGVEVQQENLLAALAELGRTVDEVRAELADEAELQSWEEALQRVLNRIQRLGAINLAAIDEYKAQSERKTYMDAQHADLVEALETLEQAIRKIDRETRSLFKETYEKVNNGFKTLFPKVFGGGRASLELTGEDLLETGVLIKAQPPGKKNGTISQLSGGEKAMTAISLVFSIFNLNPAPFCMLDEVDAPLDDVNTGRFASLVESMAEKVQFIVITHNKITMEVARNLMGVTMHEPGCSRMVSVDVEEMI